MLRFALISFSLIVFWHLCWRLLYLGIIAQSGFATDTARFYFRGLMTDLLVVIPVTIILTALYRLSPRAGRSARVLVLFASAIGFIFVSGYFQIFEKPAEFATVGAGLGSVAAEFFHSAVKEISREIALFAVGMLGASLLAIFLGRHRYVNFAVFASPLLCIGMARAGMVNAPATRDTPEWRANVHTNPFVYAYERNVDRQKLKNAMVPGLISAGKSLLWNSLSVINPVQMPATPVKRGRYNVIFYIMESTSSRYAAMKAKGQPVMPTYERLQQNAFIFEKHYTQFPLSANARYNALMSAYNPPNKNWIPMSEPDFPAPTIFETLKDAGYRTAVLHTASLDNWNYRDFLKKRRIDYQADMYTLASPEYVKTSGFSIDDRAYIKPAIDFIARSSGTPWFITFIPVMPHHPYSIPFPEFQLFSESEINTASTRQERLLREYLNSLHYADHCLGELVKALEKAGVLDDTLLFVFADHGEAFYQHPGNYLHALQLYEENVAIPFLIYNRKLFPNKNIYRGVSRSIDVAPTALDMAGIALPASYMGISLIRSHRSRLAYFHTDWENDISGVRDGDWKYTLQPEGGKEELYNLLQDPEEKNNLAAQRKDITTLLRAEVLKARDTQKQWYMTHRAKK
ncbi:MAG: sulfatase-like hydrolase/transferase [Leptospiraceae bacterium]|nr:sulfatase-like hydrolase/transferase [Leptospiraceae bacterium]